MNFINPKIDFAFKKIFGNEQHKEILISFLNAMLYEGQPTIQDLEILDPYNAPKISGLKDTFLDVKARLDSGDQVIIEMQVLAVESFGKRVLYNVAKTYSAQLKPKEDYTRLNPVIGLTITDFKMFSDAEVSGVLSRFSLYDQHNGVEYPVKDIELVFVELPKFDKPLSALQTLTDKWLYFMQYASELEEVPPLMKDEPAIEQAFQVANRVNLSQSELDELEKREFFVRDMHRLVEVAERKAQERGYQKGRQTGIEQGRQEGIEQGRQEGVEQGRQEGVEQGRQEGVEQGRQEGVEQGRQQEKLNLARQLLDILDDDIISQKTGLSLDEVKQLRDS